jgi:hypothetical protein
MRYEPEYLSSGLKQPPRINTLSLKILAWARNFHKFGLFVN